MVWDDVIFWEYGWSGFENSLTSYIRDDNATRPTFIQILCRYKGIYQDKNIAYCELLILF